MVPFIEFFVNADAIDPDDKQQVFELAKSNSYGWVMVLLSNSAHEYISIVT